MAQHEYWKASLYTAVPSRSFFPRGFLWDEGFHELLIGSWDLTISKDVVAHWLDLMNQFGWIPREQILGEEARTKVPPEFVVQNVEFANPPTLLFPIRRLLHHYQKTKAPEDAEFFRQIFPRLQVWYSWYNSTQSGSLPTTYRWRGRDPATNLELNPKTLTSGLDDYPRASHPSNSERHIDLRCWMAEASRILMEIADGIGESSAEYRHQWQVLSDNERMNSLHWDPVNLMYSDYGAHTDDVHMNWVLEEQGTLSPPALRTTLTSVSYNRKRGEKVPPTKIYVRTLDEGAVVKEQFVNHSGYINLFPFLMKLVCE